MTNDLHGLMNKQRQIENQLAKPIGWWKLLVTGRERRRMEEELRQIRTTIRLEISARHVRY